MPKIEDGAKLTTMLKASGTGDSKIDVCRKRLKEIFDAEHRVATSEEVIAAMEEKYDVCSQSTVDKARRIMMTGTAEVPVVPAEVPIEEQLTGMFAGKESEPTKKAKA